MKVQVYLDNNYLVLQRVQDDGTTAIGLPIEEPAKNISIKKKDTKYYFRDTTTNQTIIEGLEYSLILKADGTAYADEATFVTWKNTNTGKSSGGGGGSFVPSEHDLDEFQNENADPFAKLSDVVSVAPYTPISFTVASGATAFGVPANTYVTDIFSNDTILDKSAWTQTTIGGNVTIVSAVDGDKLQFSGFTLGMAPSLTSLTMEDVRESLADEDVLTFLKKIVAGTGIYPEGLLGVFDSVGYIGDYPNGGAYAYFDIVNNTVEVNADLLKFNGKKNFQISEAPVSSTSDGLQGEIRLTEDFIYVCTADNVWKRTSLVTF